MDQIVKLKTAYIKLGQLLKLINKIPSGGSSKSYLINNQVSVNDQIEKRRGRKLYDGDIIKIGDECYQVTC